MDKLRNKTAFITGGTSGIGFATARSFILEGARVIITGRDQHTLDETIKRLGPNASGFVCDAGKLSDVLSIPGKIRPYANSIDILFVNAGYGKFAPIEFVDEQGFDELFNMLVKGTFFTVQQTLGLMNAGGSIILNTSVVTEAGYSNMSVYSAAKSAVKSFIKTFAAECTQKKIRVNGISPGYIKTNGFNKTGLSAEQIKHITEATIPTLPFRRFGEASEVAAAAVFLAGDNSTYIHGAEIVVDGGLSTIK